MSRRTLRALDAASVLLALGAISLAVWPATAANDGAGTLPASLTAASALPEIRAGNGVPYVDSTTSGIVRGNVFSSTRRAPVSRFMPPGFDGSATMAPDAPYDASSGARDEALAAMMGPDSGAGTEAGTRDPVPALYGIVGIDGVRHALLALRGGEPPRLYAVGDRHAGYRISAIERDRVVLATSRGLRTLRLAPSAPRDSSENLP